MSKAVRAIAAKAWLKGMRGDPRAVDAVGKRCDDWLDIASAISLAADAMDREAAPNAGDHRADAQGESK